MSLLHTIVAFIVALGVLIFFHELGHYWIARRCGVKILRFSIGFGKPLWLKRLGPDQTEWSVAALPLGGYVRMLDEREGPVAPAEAHRAFNRQSVWKRVAIVAAGPIANFLLAIFVYAGLYMWGVSEPKPILADPTESSVAAQAGFKSGEIVRAANGVPIRTWQQFRWELLDLAVARKVVSIEVVDANQKVVVHKLDLSALGVDAGEGDPLAKVGLRLFRPPVPAVIGVTETGSPAQAAGLQPGDQIMAIDQKPVETWDDVVKTVSANAGRELALAVLRGDERLMIRIKPVEAERNGTRVGRIGAGVRFDPERMREMMVEERYGPIGALGMAVKKTGEMSVFSLRMLWKMVAGDLSWRNLSGPITIADYAGQSASLGILPYLTFIALVSISLGVLNLLPIPVLDGGHLLYYAVEILKGSPLSERAMEVGQRLGLGVLLLLMGCAFYNDINRLFSG